MSLDETIIFQFIHKSPMGKAGVQGDDPGGGDDAGDHPGNDLGRCKRIFFRKTQNRELNGFLFHEI